NPTEQKACQNKPGPRAPRAWGAGTRRRLSRSRRSSGEKWDEEREFTCRDGGALPLKTFSSARTQRGPAAPAPWGAGTRRRLSRSRRSSGEKWDEERQVTCRDGGALPLKTFSSERTQRGPAAPAPWGAGTRRRLSRSRR